MSRHKRNLGLLDETDIVAFLLPHSHSDFRITVTTGSDVHDVVVTITDKRTESIALRYGLGTSDLDVPYAEEILS
jgi:hypothetical protein